ncbi:MAG: lipoate--protein ligase family protein [Candidatus Heimdallarchaeota archaeon]|nr:lipoate--protein ligase family protein [Candidatus Heimdallarchaeota archaeon]
MSDENWRLIWVNEAADCYTNMGIDEAILNAVANNEVPSTLRFYRWKPSAVSIGYFQSMNKEVNIENCQKEGVDYTRRITGGGAVYHDFEGELTYSLVTKESNPKIPRDIVKSYQKICTGIVNGLAKLGVPTEFKPINDIVLQKNGKKISGNAQTRRKGVVLQHGTILRKVDVEKMFSILIVSDEKIRSKLISSAKERVSSLTQVLGVSPSFEEIQKSLTEGFELALNINAIPSKLTNEELLDAKNIAKTKFSNKDWLFKR